jgi:hypothetical protein
MAGMEGFCNVRAGKLNNDTLALASINGAIVSLALENRGKYKVI